MEALASLGEGMDLNRRVDRSNYSSADMPEFPARTLLQHVVIKGVQFGSFGGFIVAPAWALVAARPLSVVFPRVLFTGAAAGVGVSLGLLALRGFQGQLGVEGVDDRAFRLAKNSGQNEMDLASGIGAVAGASLGSIFGVHGLRSVATGSLVGAAGAAAGYMLQRQLQQNGDEASAPAPAAAGSPKAAALK